MMGTRNLTVVAQDGEYKVAQYGQWDGYPSGNGAAILAFLTTTDLQVFGDKVKLCRFLTDTEQKEKRNTAVPSIKGKKWIDMDESKKLEKALPELHRNAGCDILQMIYDSDGLELSNDIKFAGDGLFCEWVYVIDLDAGVLETYKGFGKDANVGRFAHLEQKNKEYTPVQLLKTYPLDNLPSEGVFVAALNALCEDDE